MFYLGIDVGKKHHVASMLGEGVKKPLFKGFSFANTTEGAESLAARISEITHDAGEVSIGMEATGHYWLALYSFLFDKGYTIHVINPIQTDGWRKGIEIRKRKTDDIDSVLIADLIRYGDFSETRLADEAVQSLRTLSRFRTYLVDSISDLKRKVICVLDQVFPEYESLFSDVFGATSKELLLEYSSPAELEKLSVETLTTFLETASRKKCGEAKAEQIIQTAKRSFGVTHCRDTFSFQLRALLSIPVRLGQSPALIPAVEQERPEDDAEIRYAVVRVECAVCQGADVLAEHHGVDQRVLVAKLGIRIDLDSHLAAGLLLDDLLRLGPACADRLGNAVLESNS